MEILTGALRNYPWGSRTMLADLRGLPSPTPTAEAELWYGAHPGDPSRIGQRTLDEIIAADPVGQLGGRVVDKFGEELPFLLKLLAADEPLSLQAHPSLEQAREGFASENQQRIPLGDGNRNYKDPNHKPELIVALSEFDALAGFRPLHQTRELFGVLECGPLDRYLTMIDPEHEEASLRALFTTWITIPRTVRISLIDDAKDACQKITDRDDWIGQVARTFIQLTHQYPDDVGALAALLLNHVTLQPGEAIHLRAGQLHAYLHGLGVEIMASSDNVLRGGLTSKYVDVPELVRILDFSTLASPQVDTAESQGVTEYPVSVDDFILSRHQLGDAGLTVDTDGPAIVLCTAGVATCGEVELTPGAAAWIPASDPVHSFTGKADTEVFYARV
ncbi:mannose-6-phosphate isomerase, class I [Corynebacterium cystitidis]|uniref:mannose-6-phosphate isomerase n=1 Tax=Corynebacterium cystitidis DSM 20524 TaxID=1121357 RepID=A0A1H9QJI7_9CORY|nr:mannose-6-phosphate isomerase, class I [Corynebacterium cystitidis]WJY81778.1 Mannose-6-phosphate isomerase [Corynebacterium cystitidis DSM 20524]SER59923.1 mannose-6-phosphate isomerase, type 1 [Corynebacterium cystitidis DSM 20524]SNV83700.1 mannose-6-phosphate isomerase [Corynebacterium cystitidis]